jgi:hypothetical protein
MPRPQRRGRWQTAGRPGGRPPELAAPRSQRWRTARHRAPAKPARAFTRESSLASACAGRSSCLPPPPMEPRDFSGRACRLRSENRRDCHDPGGKQDGMRPGRPVPPRMCAPSPLLIRRRVLSGPGRQRLAEIISAVGSRRKRSHDARGIDHLIGVGGYGSGGRHLTGRTVRGLFGGQSAGVACRRVRMEQMSVVSRSAALLLCRARLADTRRPARSL